MWRDEVGMMEMLLSYVGGYVEFNDWSSWRGLLVEILSCHENFRSQRVMSECLITGKDNSIIDCKNEENVTGNIDHEGCEINGNSSWTHPKSDNDQKLPEVKNEVDAMDFQNATVLVHDLTNENEDDDEETQYQRSDKEPDSLTSLQGVLERITADANLERVQSPEAKGNSYSYLEFSSVPTMESVSIPSESSMNTSSDPSRPYSCHICGKCFTTTTSKKGHLRLHGERHVCKLCGRAFSRKDYLMKHLRTHSGERPYRCEFCGRSFSEKSNLAMHMRTHSGERPHHCAICGKSFYRNDYLRKHILLQHSDYPSSQQA